MSYKCERCKKELASGTLIADVFIGKAMISAKENIIPEFEESMKAYCMPCDERLEKEWLEMMGQIQVADENRTDELPF